MPSKVSQSPRSRRNRLERIDIDELFDSPSNRGMLSFLERAPEEARIRLEERRKVDSAEAALTSLPCASDVPEVLSNLADGEPRLQLPTQVPIESQATAYAKHTGVDLTSVSHSPTGDMLPPVDASPLDQNHSVENDNRERISGKATDPKSHTGVDLPSVGLSHTDIVRPITTRLSSNAGATEGSAYANASAISNRLHQSPYIESSVPNESPTVGDSPARLPSSLFWRTVLDPRSTGGKLPPDVIDGTIIGRRQKIRRAVVAQDGHSSGEQLLYQALWSAARPESGSLDHRIIVAGYQGMSALCKLDKKNCKKNAKGLIDKLALEVAETYRSDERIGTTYRIFSYKEILRRREEAGMVWVVRTSGVRFVPLTDKGDRAGNRMNYGERDAPKASTLLRITGGNLPPVGNSHTGPAGNWSTASVGESPRHTVGEMPMVLGIDRKDSKETSSELPKQLGPKLRALLPSFDDDAVRQLWIHCCQIAPDCTEDDVEYCFHIKANQLLRGRKKIDNPVGIMIWSVPKTFEGTDPLHLRRRLEIERIRKAEEEERQRSRAALIEMLEDPRTSTEDKITIRQLLEEK